MKNLFGEFNPSSDQEWIDKITQDLKGKTIDEISKKRPYEGIDLDVFYSKNPSESVPNINIQKTWEISSEVDFFESVIADPIAHLVDTGSWTESQLEDVEIFCKIAKHETNKNIGVNANLYQHAGASATTELSCTLGHLNEYFHQLKKANLLTEDTVSRVSIKVGIGRDYFMEIAKLRALRILVDNLAKAYDLNTEKAFTIYAETSKIGYSSKDPDTNILRGTTACMSAIIGGSDFVIVHPHDVLGEGSHTFGNRIANNLQLMMKHEGHLDKVIDAGAGSYFIESLTKTLAENAWKKFKELEKDGGFIKSFEKGQLQKIIKKDADKRIENFKKGEDVFIGINKFQNETKALKRKKNGVVSGDYEALTPLILEDSL